MPADESDFLIPRGSVDEPDTGKTLSALQRSREGTSSILRLFGRDDLFPSSIMRVRRIRADEELDERAAERNYINSLPERNAEALENPMTPGFAKDMHRMNSGSLTGALSKFHQEIGRSIVIFYTEPGDLVVDPFAGHNSRMELCVAAGRDYNGCDLSNEFAPFNFEKAKELKRRFPNRKVTFNHCDSREQPIPDEVGDFTITSPPYWDIEFYGDEPEQLGKCGTYQDFLEGMRLCIRENYRTLKPGAFSVWAINDFRKGGVMHFYHRDIVRLGESVGFVNHDMVIIDLGRGLRDGFVNANIQLKMLPKRHEYFVVFKKPTRDDT